MAGFGWDFVNIKVLISSTNALQQEKEEKIEPGFRVGFQVMGLWVIQHQKASQLRSQGSATWGRSDRRKIGL